MFKGLSLRFRLVISFLFLAVVVGGTSFYQVNSISHLNSLFVDLINNDLARMSALQDVKTKSLELQRDAWETLQGYMPLDAQRDGGTVAHQKLEADRLAHSLQTYDTLGKDAQSINDQALLVKINTATQLLIQATAKLAEPNRLTAAEKLTVQKDFNAASTQLMPAIDDVISQEQKQVTQENAEAEATFSRTIWIIGLDAALVVLLAIVLGSVVASRMARALVKLRSATQSIASGDFSKKVEVTSHDEIGELAKTFNQMAVRLQESYARLAVQNQRDEAILNSMSEGLAAIDETGKVVLINPVATALFDISSAAEAIGKEFGSLATFIDPNKDPIPTERLPLSISLRTAKNASDIFGFAKKDGHTIEVSVSASPILLESKVVGAIVVLRDVTKEREVDRMKTEFISLASHQLRTPLSAIKWFSEMLLSGDAGQLQPEQTDFAKNISDSTERMIELVNALLNISRIESGRIMVDPKPTDLKELVSGIVTDLKAKTEERRQTLIVSVHEDLPKINLDPRLISQVYMNLLTNAIKYTPKGGEISVFISKKGNDVISQVTDNGYGIPKNQQGRIFQKFFRAENVAKVETDGTGLGLYLIKSIVESSQGKIWFESDEGKGTTFWFTLPLAGMKSKKGEVTLDN